MIWILSFLITLFVLAVLFRMMKASAWLKFTPKDPDDRYSKDNTELRTSAFIKAVGILLTAILFASFNPIAIQRIDAGNVGLKIDRIGNSKGIPVAVPVKGWVFYNDWVTDVVEFPIRQNHIAYEAFPVTVKGGFPINVAPSFNYALKPEKAVDLYINLLKGGSFSDLEDNFLKTATAIALNNASNKYAIDSIFNNKEGYTHAVAAELNKELAGYFVVTQINPGVVPPKELSDVIKNKTETIQKAQQAELDKITAQAQAETQIARARGDSAEAVIAAAGRAQAVKLEQQQLTPLYIEYLKVTRWKGEVPSTVLGGQGGVLLNIK